MKTFNELTKKELSELNEIQIDAYIDIELANQGIVKPINTVVDYPEFVKFNADIPTPDCTVYEVDGYVFTDLESAQKVSDLVGTLQQVMTDYNYNIGSEFKYVKMPIFQKPTIAISKFYSEAKYESIKEQLKQIKEQKEKKKNENEQIVDSVIDYSAIDNVKYTIKDSVRQAINFFSKAQSIASDYEKYISITNDKEQALKTLYTVYNIQDDEMKTEIERVISTPASQDKE